MSARAARASVDAYLARLRRAVSCVTRAVLLGVPEPNDHTWLATLATPPAPLSASPALALVLAYAFRSESPAESTTWTTTPVSYRYALLATNESEILAYHWHPTGSSPIVAPHLHISARHPNRDLSKSHLPTGIVSPAAFIRALITEFGVEPLRADWDTILDEA